MYAMVAETAAQHPRHTAHIFMGRRTSYRAFLQRVDAAARGLLSLGIGRGDRLTMCMPNMPLALECFYALNRIGAVASMIHPLSAPEEIAFYLKISSSKAVLTLDSFYPKVASAVRSLQQPVRLLVAAASDALPFPVYFLAGCRLLQPAVHWGLRRAGKYDILVYAQCRKGGRRAWQESMTGTVSACGSVLSSRVWKALLRMKCWN